METEKLFNHFHQNFGVVLAESDLFEVVEIVESMLKKGKANQFRVPDLSEVRLYMESKKIAEAEKNAIKFWNFYEAKGWVIGKAKMKNWKSAIATWEFPTASYEKPKSSILKTVGRNTEKWM